MTTRNLTFYSDPGHGWLAVNRADLDALGIAHLITPYSYQRAGRVYLEEDCDAATFTQAATAAGWMINIKEKNEPNADSFIRALPHFQP
jgi:hypothetical protein